MYGLVCGLKST